MIKKLGNYFFTGLFITLPIAVTVFVMLFLIQNIGAPMSKFVLVPIMEYFDKTLPASGFGGIAVDTFSTVIVILIVAVLGLLSHFFVAKMMISISEQLINKIPFMGKVYKTVKQIVDTFSKQNKAVFQKAVLVEYPRKGCYSVGFLTSEATGEVAPLKDEKMYNVFVPTTPNPTGGFLLILPESEIRILKMSVGEAMKFIISGGAVNPELTEKK